MITQPSTQKKIKHFDFGKVTVKTYLVFSSISIRFVELFIVRIFPAISESQLPYFPEPNKSLLPIVQP